MNGTFLINGIRVETRLNRIHSVGGVLQVEPKIMQVLVCLAHSPGEVISKDILIDTVWPATSATDDVLARAISELRKAFDDDPKSPRVIETIRKGGYRLLAPVSSIEARARKTRRYGLLVAGLFAVGTVILYWSWQRAGETPSPSDTLPLTSFKGVERDPAISPNGNMVAFSWHGPAQDNWDIYVTLRSEETPQRLTQSEFEDSSPAWSPDGDRIAFRRRTDKDCELIVVPAIGGNERRLASCKENNYADLVWSPDGRWLAHNDVVGDGLHAIMLVDAKSGESRPLTQPPTGIWGDFDPSFSPDGQQVAFARAQSEGIQDLMIVPVDGGPERQLTSDNRNIFGITWVPDGASILFASNRRGDYDLWRIASNGGEPLAFMTGPGSLVNPVIDRDGTTLVYEH